MKPIPFVISLLVAGAVLAIVDLCTLPTGITDEPACAPIDTVWPYPTVLTIDADSRGSIYDSLAAELGIEPAAMRAVSSIEAGHSHTAFISPGSPVVNLEVPMFKEQLQRAGLDVDSLARAVPDAFSRPSRSRYADPLLAQRAMYRAASAVNDTLAMLCTYWGMYQIRGSNWRLCGAESVRDFVKKMSQSEDMQHRLFANYIKNTGLYRPLQAHDWAAFARAYNGEGYAKHGYHTRLAAAYARYSRRGTPQSTSK